MKTTFSSGVIVTSQWLNGAQQIFFDGQNLDWHYSPLGLNSLVQTGPNGLDSAYVTLTTNQPELSPLGALISGSPVSGNKVISGLWSFGYAPLAGNPVNIRSNAPKSYTTNDKYNYANGVPITPTTPTVSQKFAALDDPDLITKLILAEKLNDLLENLEIDNGVYENTAGNCSNYSVGGGNSDVICPA
jgi:hypothetical protein